MEKIAITSVGLFGGFNVKKNGTVNITFKFSYDERVSIVQLVAMIGQSINIATKKASDRPKNLGDYRLFSFKMDRDGQTTVVFNSDVEAIDMDMIHDMLQESEELLKVRLQAMIELDDEEDDEDSEDNEDDE